MAHPSPQPSKGITSLATNTSLTWRATIRYLFNIHFLQKHHICGSALHCIAISSITTASPWLRVPLQGLCRPRRLSGTQQMPPPWPEERGNHGNLRKYPNILSASTNMISMCKHLVGEFQHSVAVSFSAIFDLHVSSTDDYFTVLYVAKTEKV